MSQHWHVHWADEPFKPKRLQNWEVPNWHPAWPDRHCITTEFYADNKGHILAGRKRSLQSPWGNFIDTWHLPRKINRRLAEELSAPPNYKKVAWAAHCARHRAICNAINPKSPKNFNETNKQKQEMLQNKTNIKSEEEKDEDEDEDNKDNISCTIDNFTNMSIKSEDISKSNSENCHANTCFQHQMRKI
ncbi:protein Flattop [Cephus cinctus]|uniref:Cilia- and flagella-associated protein 126 n=1 Tax=Cephus cinctus TaxID=211228 RepID=A0AAJ7BI42_CEPCN|nr:protein Flattop [Cephus cinctus]